MAGRKFTKQGKAKEKWTGASVGEEGLPSHQNQRDKRTGPQSQREGWVGTPGVGRRAGLDPRVRGRRGLNPRDRKPGSDPRGQGCRPASGLGPRGAGRGRICAGSAAPSTVYLCPVPGGRLIPHPQITVSPHSTAMPSPPVYPWPWLCSRDPSVPPASLRAHRACALRSCRLKSRA